MKPGERIREAREAIARSEQADGNQTALREIRTALRALADELEHQAAGGKDHRHG